MRMWLYVRDEPDGKGQAMGHGHGHASASGQHVGRLWAALVSLSVSDRVLLGWHCRARPREIAAVLRVPLAEVKARRAEALSRLRLRLAQSDFEEPQEMQETIASAGSGAGAMAKSDHRR